MPFSEVMVQTMLLMLMLMLMLLLVLVLVHVPVLHMWLTFALVERKGSARHAARITGLAADL